MNQPTPEPRLYRLASRGAFALSLLAALAAVACTGSDLDEDNARGLAKQLPIGQVATDNLNPPDDSSDWKVIQVPGAGFLTITVFWDNAEIEANSSVVDNFGRTLQSVPRDSRTPRDQMIIKAEGASFYYLHVSAVRDASVYSVQTSFTGAGGTTGTPSDDEPIPEFIGPIEVGAEGEEVQ